ncbi:coatomer subunit gamma, partial [Exophiala xenobiotica]
MEEEDDIAERFIKNDSMFSLSTFEHKLVMYVTSDDKSIFSKAFDVSSVPVVSHEQALAEERTKKLTTATPTLKAPSTGLSKPKANGAAEGQSAAAAAQKYTEIFSRIPELAAYGPVLKSSSVVELTESEAEYVVSAVKHIFKEHVVIQYDIKNTLDQTVIENVTMLAAPSEDEEPTLEEEFIIPATALKTNEPGVVYVAFKKLGGEQSFPTTTFGNVLKFTSKEIDPTTGEAEEAGYDDEYEVENLELTGADFVSPAFAGSFDHIWEGTGANGEEASETLQLANVKSLADATEQLAQTMSLQPLE